MVRQNSRRKKSVEGERKTFFLPDIKLFQTEKLSGVCAHLFASFLAELGIRRCTILAANLGKVSARRQRRGCKKSPNLRKSEGMEAILRRRSTDEKRKTFDELIQEC